MNGDAIRLSQVIINLVGNAIKFTQKGKVELRVTKIDETDNKVNLLFEIEDTGQGIPIEKQENIFDMY